MMSTKFIRVLCDVSCSWSDTPPRYRAYVNDELFTERTWIWTDSYLEELLQIQAPSGKYTIRYELVEPDSARLKVKNMHVEAGDAVIRKNILEILS